MLRNALIALVLTGCHATPAPVAPGAGSAAAPAAVGLIVAPPFATPGERMTYRLSLRGVEIAGFDYGVGEVSDVAGKRAIEIQGHARALGIATWVSKIDDKLTSWIDVTTGRSVRFVVDEKATTGDAIEHTDAQLATRTADSFQILAGVDAATPVAETQHASGPDIWDFNSFLCAMRGWEGPAGTTVTVEVLRSRYVWHVQMTIHGKEKQSTELGELPALRLDGIAYKLDRKGVRVADSDERHFSLWISDDNDRVPLALSAVTDYGDVKMAITEYTPGTGARLRK